MAPAWNEDKKEREEAARNEIREKLDNWASTKRGLKQGDMRVWIAVMFVVGVGTAIILAIGFGLSLIINWLIGIVGGIAEWLGGGLHQTICEFKASSVAELKEQCWDGGNEAG